MNGGRTAPASPSVATPLGATGVHGKITGVTRIGARAGLLAIGILGAIVLAIVYGISASGNHPAGGTAVSVEPQILPTTGPGVINIPGFNATPQPAAAPHKATPVRQRMPATAPVLPDPAVSLALVRAPDVPEIRTMPNTTPQTAPAMQMPAAPAVDPKLALKLQAEQQQMQLADAARKAGIMVKGPGDAGAVAGAAANDARSAPIAVAAPSATPAAGAAPDVNADPTVASQRAKNDFLSLQKSTTASDYITTPRQASISQYEVQAGSIIPGILVTGINSDLPGTMIGQVSQNVYDSKTGQYLLIPAGSKIVGRYDSQVTNGQSRVLVAWQRILFPDSSFIDINGMAGADTAGYSGLTGKVDDHSGKLFRNAILFSLIGAGAALLQPRTAIAALTPVGMVAAPSVGSQAAGQVGTQLAQTAQQATQKGLQQQPTIEVRPGYLFNIMVDRDLVFPGPYTNTK